MRLRIALLRIRSPAGCPLGRAGTDYPGKPVHIIVGFAAGGGNATSSCASWRRR